MQAIVIGYSNMEDKIISDTAKPNGQEYRAYNLTKLFNAGFKSSVTLIEGLQLTYDWYSANAEYSPEVICRGSAWERQRIVAMHRYNPDTAVFQKNFLKDMLTFLFLKAIVLIKR